MDQNMRHQQNPTGDRLARQLMELANTRPQRLW